MHTLVVDFNGNSNLGLYGFVNDKYLLLGQEIPTKHDKELEDVFKVPIHRITIAGTSLIGVFVAGDNKKIIVPSIIFDDEKKHLEELGIDYEVFQTKLTCLGNNIKVTEKLVIVNPEYTEAQAKKIGEIFNKNITKMKIAGIGTIGNLLVCNENNKKALVSNEVMDAELDELEKSLGMEIEPTSVNMGSQFVGSGIICNKNGFAIGKMSGSPEILNAETSLGFLKNE